MVALYDQYVSLFLFFSLLVVLKFYMSARKENTILSKQNSEYQDKYSVILDSKEEAKNIIINAESEARSIQSEADKIKLNAENEAEKIRLDANEVMSSAGVEANQLIYKTKGEVDRLKSEEYQVRIDIENVKLDYKEKKKRYDELVRAVAILDEEFEYTELGFYKPHFDFDSSEEFKEEINEVRYEQKEMLRDKEAVLCNTEWLVEGSRSKGQAMTNQGIRLTARAFNNECDAAVSNVRWNNILKMEARVEAAFESINKLNKSNKIKICYDYLDLKLKELRLTHEYREQKQREKEEKSEIRRQEREEAQLLKEAAEAAKEEKKYASLLKKAQQQAETATDYKLEALKGDIATLTAQLEAAHAKSERALSMAQQTKAGYVYVISNVGSFGEGVYKIGMTRRLEPMDRVKELGDASVPFLFDTHAMIFSENAPRMESQLHKEFEDRRLNKVNNRKEFFRVTLDEVRSEVRRLFPNADFIETVEARDFRETRAMEERLNHAKVKASVFNRFSAEL